MTEPNLPASPSDPAAPPASTPAPPSEERGSSVKETIESILVAFILAFIFRAFVVEAFVIPTGSMAPTLLGAHMRFQCQDCGYQFDVNWSNPGGGDDLDIPARAGRKYTVFCPNCGYQVPGGPPSDLPGDATNPPVRFGDRILVLKYLYLFEDPKRWDVVVFKAPADPEKYDYTQNYIKRLIGKPGETIMILDGDIYVAAKGTEGKDSDFKIQTKPADAQQALWRIVYNNDFYPKGIPHGRRQPWQQPWQVDAADPATSGWTLDRRQFTFKKDAGSATLFFNADAEPRTHWLSDWLAYDQESPAEPFSYIGHNVSDLKLSMVYDRDAGEGPLKLILTKQRDIFTAEVGPKTARLLRSDGSGEHEIASAAINSGSGSLKLDFTNVDYKVTLKVNGQVLLQTTPEQYHPDVSRLLEEYRDGPRAQRPTIQIVAANQHCRITHLGLWRDVYYLNRDPQGRSTSIFWGSPDDRIRLNDEKGKEEYFVLGDNSLISGDARYWADPINLPQEDLKVDSGRVPARFLLGKAFFVYWPAGFPPIGNAPNLVPNFGEMRFIH
jgi:signal peptidase I